MVVRRLQPGERAWLEGHLLRLDREDRRLRFCGVVSDDFLRGYCRRLDGRVAILGCFMEGVLRGAAEVVPIADSWPASAEIALTVEGPFQDRGLGTQLLRRALLLARNRFTSTVHVTLLMENRKMRHLAAKAGARLAIRDGMVEGTFRPGWPDWLSLLEEAAGEGRALIDGTLAAGGGEPEVRTRVVGPGPGRWLPCNALD